MSAKFGKRTCEYRSLWPMSSDLTLDAFARRPSIWVQRDESVATIWLNRPDKRNAMTLEMWQQMRAACVDLDTDRAVRVVVLRGVGQHFCAGADIHDLHAPRRVGETSFLDVSAAAEDALANLGKPTVAVITGDCIGGGCALAVDCDLRIASRSSRFGITPSRLGIAYPTASVERLTSLVGVAAAKYLLMTADLIDAARAERLGLLTDVVDEARLDDARQSLVTTLVARSLFSQLAAKEMIGSIAEHGSVTADVIARWARVAARSGDAAEGLAAFAERRSARFTDVPARDAAPPDPDRRSRQTRRTDADGVHEAERAD